mmetsp:Transcript_1382/g.4539  ORF Transcript_1382/g.4539 Transcript_1382/m.4539 type:complete len:280 (+) Transcript_1382:270-1109(+)
MLANLAHRLLRADGGRHHGDGVGRNDDALQARDLVRDRVARQRGRVAVERELRVHETGQRGGVCRRVDGRAARPVDARLLLGARPAKLWVVDAVAADAAVGRRAARAAAAAHKAPARRCLTRRRLRRREQNRRAVGCEHARGALVAERIGGGHRRRERDGCEGHVGRERRALARRRDRLQASPLLARLLLNVCAPKLLLVDARLARAAVDGLAAEAAAAAARLVARGLVIHARRRALHALALRLINALVRRALVRQAELFGVEVLARLEEELQSGDGVE